MVLFTAQAFSAAEIYSFPNYKLTVVFGFLWDNGEGNVEVKWVKPHAALMKHDLPQRKKKVSTPEEEEKKPLGWFR